MRLKLSLSFGIFLFALLSIANAQLSAPATPISSQYYEPSIDSFYSQQGIDYTTFWPDFATPESCLAKPGQDFFVSIVPFSCSPSVVRSDLLEDQNVPVFCRLSAVRVNPLMEIAEVKSVAFSGRYPTEVAGVSYHPSKALLKSYNPQLGTGMINDLGYVVVLLKKQPSEKNMSKKINFTLTATIQYDLRNVQGVGKAMFYLPVMTNEEWSSNYIEYGFWKNKGYIRAEGIEQDRAKISIYSDRDSVIRSFDLKKGETSSIIYMPGFYCQGGLQVKLDEVSVPKKSALLQVDDEKLWVSEGSRFLDSCSVSKIEVLGTESRVVLNCEGKSYELRLKVATKAKINNVQFATGERVGKDGNEDVHLVYIDEKGKFVILAKAPAKHIQDNKISSERIRTIYSSIKELVNQNKRDEAKAKVSSLLGITDPNNAVIAQVGSPVFGQTFNGIFTTSDQGFSSDKNVQAQIDKYFEDAKKTAEELVELYPAEKDKTGVFGARALVEIAELAKNLNKFETARGIYEKVIEIYPNTEYGKEAEKGLKGLFQYSFEDASTTVMVKRQAYNIFLEEIKEPTAEEAGAIFRVGDKEEALLAGETRDVGSNRNIKLVNILDENNIIIDYTYKTTDGKIESISKKQIRENEGVPGTDIVLQTVNFKRVAGIELLPNFPNELSKTNFSIAIGIEKRDIKLSPEKAKEKILGLNKSIQKYEQIVNRLANFTDGMQKACFVTSSVLLLKNFIQGAGGKGMARNEIMTKPGGWNTWCNEHKNEYGGSADNCIFQNRDKIEAGVNAVAKGYQDVNTKIGEARATAQQQKTSTEDAFIKTQFAGFVDKNRGQDVTIDGQTYQLGNALGIRAGDNADAIARKINASYNAGVLSMDDMKNIMVYGSLPNTGQNMPDFKGENLGSILKDVETSQKGAKDSQTLSLVAGTWGPGASFNIPAGIRTEDVDTFVVKTPQVFGSISNGDLVDKTATFYLGKKKDGSVDKLLITLTPTTTGANTYTAEKVYVLNEQGQAVSVGNYGEYTNLPSVFKKQTAETCRNEYKEPKVKVFDTGPCKGRAQVVPVDVKKGWYAAIKPAVYGAVKTCTESGQVMSMWLCNVGPNGREEFDSGSNDDRPCIQVNFETGQPLGQIPCLSSSEATTMVRQAKSLLESASSQYGKKSMSLASGAFNVIVASSSTGAKCTDFMSPGDCKLMFNVCDPVICPNSRCDLGGKFKVPDVIQSGIIGSLMLCLPNVKEGIYIPVCLSGLREGVRGYVALLKSYRDCLQEYVDTGKQTGFCDEIHSFYMCDFFWRQIGPLLDVGIPKLIEAMMGQGRGGGEYMTVNYAWENMKSSVGYIQNQYSTQISRAFQVGSTAEFGAEICNNFVSGNYPILGDLADSLLSPESPVQFQAWFDEIPFSDVTVPPTSQYKVYYNIYAGANSGAQFSVYLKSKPQAGYVVQQTEKVVASGYVGMGQTASETKDFTAPSGYSEICIRVNAQEECGFQRVSTSFALEFLNDKYMQQQATQNVTSERECVGGTPSLYSLAQPSLQAGVEELAQPSIYQRGIIRVCSTDNPGQTTEPGRWSAVGYCDKAKGIKCWLDEQSISKAIQGAGIENATLTTIETLSKTIGIKEGTIQTSQTTQGDLTNLENQLKIISIGLEKITNVNDLINVLGASATTMTAQPVIGGAVENAVAQNLRALLSNAINKANEIIDRGNSNQQRANALFIKFQIYQAINEKLGELSKVQQPGKPVEAGKEEVSTDFQAVAKSEVSGTFTDLAAGIDDIASIACFLSKEAEEGPVPVQEAVAAGAAATTKGVAVAGLASELSQAQTVLVESGAQVFKASGVAEPGIEWGSVVNVQGVAGSFVKEGGQIIGKVTTGGKVANIAPGTAGALQRAGQIVKSSAIRPGGIVQGLEVSKAAKLVDASGKAVGSLDSATIVSQKGALKLIPKASKFFKVLNTIGTVLVFYDMFCTGLTVNHAIIATAEETNSAQASIYQAEAMLGDIVVRSLKHFRELENNTLSLISLYENYKQQEPKLAVLENDVKNINASLTSLKKDYRFLRFMYVHFYGNGFRESEGLIFGTEKRITEDESVEIIKQDRKFNSEMRKLNSEIAAFNEKILKIINGEIVSPTELISEEAPKPTMPISNSIRLEFDDNINDIAIIKWDFIRKKLAMEIMPNGGRSVTIISSRDLFKTEITDDVVDEDLSNLNFLFAESNSPLELSQNTYIVLRSHRASINNDGKYDLSVEDINKILYGSETAPSS